MEETSPQTPQQHSPQTQQHPPQPQDSEFLSQRAFVSTSSKKKPNKKPLLVKELCHAYRVQNNVTALLVLSILPPQDLPQHTSLQKQIFFDHLSKEHPKGFSLRESQKPVKSEVLRSGKQGTLTGTLVGLLKRYSMAQDYVILPNALLYYSQ